MERKTRKDEKGPRGHSRQPVRPVTRELRYLIDEMRFFELPTELLVIQGADLFNYTMAIEMDGKRHSVRCYDDTVPEALRPLLRWLSELASGSINVQDAAVH